MTSSVVRVRRTGGFIGRPVESAVDLGSADDRAVELRGLVSRFAEQRPTTSRPYPDGFTYEFDVGGEVLRVFESDLTPDLRRIAELVLEA